jgi:hypothetical protein
MADDESKSKRSLGDLPKWPEEARELPEVKAPPKPKRRLVWTFVFAFVGAFSGLGYGFRNAPREGESLMVAYALGTAVGGAIVFGALGLLADELRLQREEHDRRWKDN